MKLADGNIAFLDKYRNTYPPNMIVVVDTHADSFSGFLQHEGGETTTNKSATVEDILIAYLGTPLLERMCSISTSARNDNRVAYVKKDTKPWSSAVCTVRGGWRILTLVTCGPAVKEVEHWQNIKGLVTK